MSTPAPPSYAGYRFPAEIISFTVWLYFRFPLSLRHVDEILATRGIVVSHETIRQWGLKFGQAFANQIRRRLPRAGDRWHLDEVAVNLTGAVRPRTAAWYDKREPTFSDAIAAVRRALWRPPSLSMSHRGTEPVEISAALLQRLTDTLCHAA
jgi:hypothetical protein